MATAGQRLGIAVKEALRGNIDTAFKSLTLPGEYFGDMLAGGVVYSEEADPAQYRSSGLAEDGWLHTVDGSGYSHFKYAGYSSSLTAYRNCAPIAAILNRKAQCFINGKTWVLNTQDKESRGGNAGKVMDLLRRPNPGQSQKEFECEAYISIQLFGWTLLYLPKPVGFTDNIDALGVYNLPPNILKIELQPRAFFQRDLKGFIKSITAEVGGLKVSLNIDDCYIIKDFVPSFCASILPSSRMQSIESAVSNWIGAMDSRQTLINYRGMLGIISQDPGGAASMGGNLPMTKEDKEMLQMDVAKYGLRRGQLQFIITKATLKWQQMGYPTKELMLFEECEADAQLMCDVFNYPYRLLASNTANSLGGTDADIFTRNLYQDAIIPEAESFYEQITQMFGLEDLNLRLDKDFSHIPVLQEDKVKQAEARRGADIGFQIEFYMNALTINEWRVHLGEDPILHGDKYYYELVAMGWAFGAAKTPGNGQQGQATNADGTPVEAGTATQAGGGG